MGWLEKSEKQSETKKRKTIFFAEFFRRIFPRIFHACFSAVRTENVAAKRSQHKNPALYDDLVKNADQVVLQTHQCAYAGSEKDLEKRIFSSTRSSAPLLQQIKFALLRGVGRGGREENCPKKVVFF